MILPQKVLHLHIEEDKLKPKHIGHNYMLSQKHDGWYGYMDIPACVIRSSSGREIPSLVELSNKIRENAPKCRGRLIFEIMIEGLENTFHVLNGILNRKREQADDVYLRVHDYLPDFRQDVKADVRFSYACEVANRIDMQELQVAEIIHRGDSKYIWQTLCDDIWRNGGEGVILKRCDGYYSPGKRNYDLMKIKEELTLDLLVVGILEGAGKYESTVGKLVVKDRAGNVHNVSGMTDLQRDTWWQQPGDIIGKIVEIKAMQKLPDGSLREPRFKHIRFDKVASDID